MQVVAAPLQQRVFLKVDVAKEQLRAWTDLELAPVGETVQQIALFCGTRDIQEITIDGQKAEFEFVKRLSVEDYNINIDDCALPEAADLVHKQYWALLEAQSRPNLLITVPRNESLIADSAANPAPSVEPRQTDTDKSPEVHTVLTISYTVNKSQDGIYFDNEWAYSTGNMGSTADWLPHGISTETKFEITIVCNDNLTALSLDILESCELVKNSAADSTRQRAWSFRSSIPISSDTLGFVVGPMVCFQDPYNSNVVHYGPERSLESLQDCTSTFYLMKSSFDRVWNTALPWRMYRQVFIPSDKLGIDHFASFASLSIITARPHLCLKMYVETSIQSRITQAEAYATSMFGVWLRCTHHGDEWLFKGLVHYFGGIYVQEVLGKTEHQFRCISEWETVCSSEWRNGTCLAMKALTGRRFANEHGRQEFDPISIFKWKSAAVIRMLERRVTSEHFNKVLQIFTMGEKQLTTRELLKQCRSLGGYDKQLLKVFEAQWIRGQGCPKISVASRYVKRKNALEIAVKVTPPISKLSHASSVARYFNREEGIEKKSSSREVEKEAIALVSKCATEAEWSGTLKLVVQEINGPKEHVISLRGVNSDDGVVYQEIPVFSKPSVRKSLQKSRVKKRENENMNGRDGEADQMQEQKSLTSPVTFLVVDPQMDWLAMYEVHQSEDMWTNQLEKDNSMIGQLVAIRNLHTLCIKAANGEIPVTGNFVERDEEDIDGTPGSMTSAISISYATTNALKQTFLNEKLFCKIRVEALFAIAEASVLGDQFDALSSIIRFYKEKCYDPVMGMPKAYDFTNLDDYFIVKAIPLAMSKVREHHHNTLRSPPEAAETLLQISNFHDNSENSYSSDQFLSNFLIALGNISLLTLPSIPKDSDGRGTSIVELVCPADEDIKHIDQLSKKIESFLLRALYLDSLVPSEGNIVTVAAIESLCRFHVSQVAVQERPRSVLILKNFEALLQCYLEDCYHVDIFAIAFKARCIFQSLLNSADMFTHMLASVTSIGRKKGETIEQDLLRAKLLEMTIESFQPTLFQKLHSDDKAEGIWKLVIDTKSNQVTKTSSRSKNRDMNRSLFDSHKPISSYRKVFRDANSSLKVLDKGLSPTWRALTTMMFETSNAKLQHLCFICLQLLGGRPPYVNRSLDVPISIDDKSIGTDVTSKGGAFSAGERATSSMPIKPTISLKTLSVKIGNPATAEEIPHSREQQVSAVIKQMKSTQSENKQTGTRVLNVKAISKPSTELISDDADIQSLASDHAQQSKNDESTLKSKLTFKTSFSSRGPPASPKTIGVGSKTEDKSENEAKGKFLFKLRSFSSAQQDNQTGIDDMSNVEIVSSLRPDAEENTEIRISDSAQENIEKGDDQENPSITVGGTETMAEGQPEEKKKKKKKKKKKREKDEDGSSRHVSDLLPRISFLVIRCLVFWLYLGCRI